MGSPKKVGVREDILVHLQDGPEEKGRKGGPIQNRIETLDGSLVEETKAAKKNSEPHDKGQG